MSFVKHALFVNDDAPDLEDYEALSDYICDRLMVDNMMISEGVCDALDHSSDHFAYGGKLGIDCTDDNVNFPKKIVISDAELAEKMIKLVPEIIQIKQYKTYTKTPICVIAINKKDKISNIYQILKVLKAHTKLLIFVDSDKNDIQNPYMLIWRVANNIDAARDIYLEKEFIGVDATNKGKIENFPRRWPDDTDCDKDVIKSLQEKGLINVDEAFLKKFYI